MCGVFERCKQGGATDAALRYFDTDEARAQILRHPGLQQAPLVRHRPRCASGWLTPLLVCGVLAPSTGLGVYAPYEGMSVVTRLIAGLCASFTSWGAGLFTGCVSWPICMLAWFDSPGPFIAASAFDTPYLAYAYEGCHSLRGCYTSPSGGPGLTSTPPARVPGLTSTPPEACFAYVFPTHTQGGDPGTLS